MFYNKSNTIPDGPKLDKEPDNRFIDDALIGKGVSIVCPSCGIKDGCVVRCKMELLPGTMTNPVVMLILTCRYCQAELAGAFPDDERILQAVIEVLYLMNDWFPAVAKATAEYFERQHKERGGLLS